MMLWWTEELSSGIEFIDDQHRELFKLINEVFSAVNVNDAALISNTLDYLLHYVIEHFGAEESCMIKGHYPDFEEHREQHSYFIKQVYRLFCRFEAEKASPEFMNDFQLLMVEWLVDHISETDKRLAEYLRRRT